MADVKSSVGAELNRLFETHTNMQFSLACQLASRAINMLLVNRPDCIDHGVIFHEKRYIVVLTDDREPVIADLFSNGAIYRIKGKLPPLSVFHPDAGDTLTSIQFKGEMREVQRATPNECAALLTNLSRPASALREIANSGWDPVARKKRDDNQEESV